MKTRLRRSNTIAIKALKRGAECQHQGISHTVEHPWHSWMWEMQPAKQLEQDSHTYACSSACCFGGAREKWTGVLANSQTVALAIHQPECPGHDRLRSYEVEERPDGSLYYPTEEEAAYPTRWCYCYAQGLQEDFSQQGYFEEAYHHGCLAWLEAELAQSTPRLQECDLKSRASQALFAVEEDMKRGMEKDHLAVMARRASIRGADI